MAQRAQSIVTRYEGICLICGHPAEATHHLIFGVERSRADADGLIIPLCNNCHNMAGGTRMIHGNSMAEALSKMMGQLAWEKDYYRDHAGEHGNNDPARDAFMKRYGRSYL